MLAACQSTIFAVTGWVSVSVRVSVSVSVSASATVSATVSVTVRPDTKFSERVDEEHPHMAQQKQRGKFLEEELDDVPACVG